LRWLKAGAHVSDSEVYPASGTGKKRSVGMEADEPARG